MQGKQRYKCKRCGCNFTKSERRGVSLKKKALAYVLYLEGLGFRSIGRVLGVSNVSVLRWIRTYAKTWGNKVPKVTPSRHCRVIEIDEMWHYIQKKNRKSGFGLLLIETKEKSLHGKLVVVEQKHVRDYSGD